MSAILNIQSHEQGWVPKCLDNLHPTVVVLLFNVQYTYITLLLLMFFETDLEAQKIIF